MDRQRIVINKLSAVIPQNLQQAFPRHHGRVIHQHRHNLEFRQRQRKCFPVLQHLHPVPVNHKSAPADRPRCLAAAQQHTHPAEQLLHPEGLGHIVVAAGVQSPDHVKLFAPGSQEQDRTGFPRLAPFLAQADPVSVRQAHIHNDHLHRVRQFFPGFPQAAAGNHFIPVPAEQFSQSLPEGCIVFHQQYGIHLSSYPVSLCSRVCSLHSY